MNNETGSRNNEEGKTKIVSFKDLDAWKEGHVLVLQIYRLTRKFPKDELFALVSQMRRAAVSITSNIAEGFGRGSMKEKIQFYTIAHGSVTELQNQLLVSRDVGYISSDQFAVTEEQSTRVHKILTGLIKKSREWLKE